MALGLIAGLAGSALNAITGGAINKIMSGNSAQKQYEEQKNLQGLQIQGGKEMADYAQQKQMENWENTNAAAQVEQYKKAGLNPALMYGGGGTGGQLGSGMGAMPTGATAPSATERESLNLQKAMNVAQMGLIAAQTQKTNAETKKIGGIDTTVGEATAANTAANTANTKWQTEVAQLLGLNGEWKKQVADLNMKEINAEKANIEWEAEKAAKLKGGQVDGSDMVKNIERQLEMTKQQLKAQTIANKTAEAEATIKQFTAKLTQQGIAEGSPWYVKMVGDLLNSMGINPVKQTGDEVRKLH